MNNNNKEQQFVNIYKKYIDEVYKYIFLRTGLEKNIAEDISQEIFFDVYKGINKFKGLCSERTWIFKITRNKVYDYYRKQYKKCFESVCIDNEPLVQISDSKQDIESLIERTYESKCVLKCLDHLPQHYKIVLLLKYIDCRSVKEIAAILDKSNKAIDNILQRAKSAFIKYYKIIQSEDYSHEE